MHIDEVRAILRKHLKREPTYDDIAEALSGYGRGPTFLAIQKELENLKRLRKTVSPARK